MKKKLAGIISIALAAGLFCTMFLTGCGLFGTGDSNDDDSAQTPTEYTIQYTDDVGTHTLTVTDGAPYALEVLPERVGYDFLGLFDAEVGGTQYVSASGASLAPFTDKKNMVLFPQFAAKEYTVVLDYQGAEVTGQRSVTVQYGEKLPELPKNLSKEHSVFAGWYTEENCGGTQVADAYGLIPDKSTLNTTLFDISAGEYLYLYAGFDVETFTVTFNFGSGIPSEEMEVEYNTPVSEVIPETRNEQGQAVLSWSKTSGGDQLFTGNITDDTVLYAVEWAPVIELDLNGGTGKTAVIARAGTAVALPTPERENYKFLHWETMSGNEADITEMPANGAQLKAVWQAMLVFDENGGTEVKDISQAAGTAVTLPTPEKEGFIFAGWYTADKERYTSTSMPSTSVELKAGWYASKEITLDYASGDETKFVDTDGTFFTADLTQYDKEVDLSGSNIVTVSGQFMADQRSAENVVTDGWHNLTVGLYRAADFGTIYELTNTWYFPHGNIPNYQQRTFNATIEITDGRFYIGMIATNSIGHVYIQEFYVTITYPDTVNLYL